MIYETYLKFSNVLFTSWISYLYKIDMAQTAKANFEKHYSFWKKSVGKRMCSAYSYEK